MKCRKCGSEKMGVMPNKKNPSATDLYCTECGAWQKFATRDEIRLYQTRKATTTNADRIRAMSDEELVNVVPCPLGFSMFRCPIERQCGPCKREWLQQPAEEADHA